MNLSGLVTHLEELRRRSIYVLIVFVVVLVAGFAFAGKIYQTIVLPNVHLVILGPGDVVHIYLMIAGLSALGLSSPFALVQLWRFVSPGLNSRERRLAIQLIGPALMMFLIGMGFSYFVVFPRIYRFLLFLAVHNSIQPVITANEYFGFLMNLIIPFGFIFETPVLAVFLTAIRVVTPKGLRKMRRHAYAAWYQLGFQPP